MPRSPSRNRLQSSRVGLLMPTTTLRRRCTSGTAAWGLVPRQVEVSSSKSRAGLTPVTFGSAAVGREQPRRARVLRQQLHDGEVSCRDESHVGLGTTTPSCHRAERQAAWGLNARDSAADVFPAARAGDGTATRTTTAAWGFLPRLNDHPGGGPAQGMVLRPYEQLPRGDLNHDSPPMLAPWISDRAGS